MHNGFAIQGGLMIEKSQDQLALSIDKDPMGNYLLYPLSVKAIHSQQSRRNYYMLKFKSSTL